MGKRNPKNMTGIDYFIDIERFVSWLHTHNDMINNPNYGENNTEKLSQVRRVNGNGLKLCPGWNL